MGYLDWRCRARVGDGITVPTGGPIRNTKVGGMLGSRRLLRGLLALTVAPVSVAGCGNGNGAQEAEDTARDVAESTEERAQGAAESLGDGWATLRTEAEGLIDDISTRHDPEAKSQLLEKCRERLEDLRRADSDEVGRVESLCDRIRDTDVDAGAAWAEIKDEIDSIDVGN